MANVVNQLLNALAGPQQTNTQDLRVAEVQDLVAYAENLKVKEKKSKSRRLISFLAMGGLLLGSAVVSFFEPLRAAVFGGDPEALSAISITLLVILASFALRHIKTDPLTDLRERIEKLHKSLNLPSKRLRLDGLFKSKRDSVMTGVAGGIAERLNISSGLVRFLMLLLIPVTSGGIIFVYFALALALSTAPNEEV